MNMGPPLSRGPQQPSNFWEFLRSWGGEWMWDGIKDSQDTKQDLSVVGRLESYRTHVLSYSTYVLLYSTMVLLARPTKVRR